KVVFVTEGKDAATIEAFVASLHEHGGESEQIMSVSIDMSSTFIKGVAHHLRQAPRRRSCVESRGPNAARIEQRTDPELKGLRWSLLKDRYRLTAAQRADLDALIVNVTTKRTARAWRYREQLRESLDRKQINVVSEMLEHWRTNVMRSKVDPMKDVARMIRSHFDGIVAWTQARQTNGFLGSHQRTLPDRQAKGARDNTTTSRPCAPCCF
ncbi:MAG: transposase, partial [Burkholderia sp.]